MNTQLKLPLSIFLCHSQEDKLAVRELYKRLGENGYSPWLDEESLVGGQAWEKETVAAVRSSDVVLVCLSHSSINKKGFVQKEIKFALDVADEQPEGAIFIIPVKLEECDVPNRLRLWHWVNYFDERGYERLTKALERRAGAILTTREKLAGYQGAAGRATPVTSSAGGQQTLGAYIEGDDFSKIPLRSRLFNLLKKRWPTLMTIIIAIVCLGISFPLLLYPGETNVVDNASEQVFSHSKVQDISVSKDTLVERPRTAEEFYGNGIYFLSIRNYDAAVRELRQAVALRPDFPAAHNCLGRALSRMTLFKQAEEAFRTAVEQSGGRYPTAQYNLGYAMQQQRKAEKAIEAYLTAIDANGGDYSDAYYQIGSVLLGTPARAAEAAEAFRKAIEQNKGRDPEAYRLLGVALVQQKDYVGAEAAFREAINQRGGDFASANYNLGQLYQQTGKTDDAIVAFENYLRQEPGDLDIAHYNLGLLYKKVGRINEAIKEFETYLEQTLGGENSRQAENTLRDLRRQAARAADSKR